MFIEWTVWINCGGIIFIIFYDGRSAAELMSLPVWKYISEMEHPAHHKMLLVGWGVGDIKLEHGSIPLYIGNGILRVLWYVILTNVEGLCMHKSL